MEENQVNVEELYVDMEGVEEPTIIFKSISDRTSFKIVSDDINETLVEISGYDLQVNFNMAYINSVEDVEDAVSGISDLFRRIILDKLLQHQKQSQ